MIYTRITASKTLVAMLVLLTSVGLFASEEPSKKETLKNLDKLLEGDSEHNISPLTPGKLRAFHTLLSRIEEEDKNKKTDKPISNPAVNKAMKVMFGNLTPDQIRAIRKALDEIEKAKSEPVKMPKLIQRTVPVNLEPDAPITRIKLGANHITTLSFFDNTGAPFPVEHFSPSIKNTFTVTHPDNPEKRHILEISPKKHYKYGNISLTFKGMPVPISLQLVVGFDDSIDAVPHIIIPRPGPNARITNRKPVFSGKLTAFLDGTPPAGAVLKKNDGLIKVWEYEGLLYVRTKADLILPPPIEQGDSGTGTWVYLTHKSSSLRLAIDGQYKVVKVNE